MSENARRLAHRRFLKTTIKASTLLIAPQVIAATALGRDGAVAPSERIVMGGIGIGNRGTYDLGCFLEQPDVQFVAIADAKAVRRAVAKKMVDDKNGNQDCVTYRDLRELLARDDIDAVLIATGPNWHATAAALAARAGKDMYCEKPCTKNINQSLALAADHSPDGPRVPGRHAAAQPAALCVRLRTGADGQARKTPDDLMLTRPAWPPPAAVGPRRNRSRPRKKSTGICISDPQPGGRSTRGCLADGFNFEKGGGLVGGGVLEWGSHCVDLCQWANNSDNTAPVEYNPPENGTMVARYANGVKLVLRNEGWLPLGSCPVRFEGDQGWIETGDSGKFVLSSPALLAGRKVAEIGGYPATFHVRDFLNCVKSRGKPLANADVACYSHITCHAAGITSFLNRKLTYDPQKNEFIGDEQANRLRGEAIRDPWRI